MEGRKITEMVLGLEDTYGLDGGGLVVAGALLLLPGRGGGDVWVVWNAGCHFSTRVL
jgi:hypothetical protein